MCASLADVGDYAEIPDGPDTGESDDGNVANVDSTASDESAVTITPTLCQPARRRGRPKKRPHEQTITQADILCLLKQHPEIVSRLNMPALTESPKQTFVVRGRDRPRKHPLVEAAPPEVPTSLSTVKTIWSDKQRRGKRADKTNKRKRTSKKKYFIIFPETFHSSSHLFNNIIILSNLFQLLNCNVVFLSCCPCVDERKQKKESVTLL